MPKAWRARLFADRWRGHQAGSPQRQTARRGGRRARSADQPIEYSILVTATLCLLAAGAVMVYSASSAPTVLQGHGNGTGYLVRFAIYGAIGLLMMRFFARNGLEAAARVTGPLLVASFVLVLAVHVPHLGVRVNGARRWIGTGPLQFQPSELMKLALVLYSAELLARRPERVLDLGDLARPLLLVVGGACLLVVTQPDLGTALVIAFTIGSLLIAAGMPIRHLALLAGVGLTLIFLYALVQPYSRARLTSFLHPWSHAGSSGFQAVQGQIAMGSGGLFGVGPGQSVQKIFYLPEAHTDFILAVIGEELGVVGVCGLLFLYGMIAFAGLRAAKAARSLHSALVAVGVTSLILSQAVLNVFAVLGLAPLTGVPLPFISYGSSNLIVMLAGMGLLLNVASGQSAHLRAVEPRAAARSRDRGPGKAAAPSRRRPAASAASHSAAGHRAAPRAEPAPRAGRAPRAADARPRESARWTGADPDEDRDRRRWDRGARRAGPGGGRRAAG
jgi:cell division protein FtsW